MITMVLAFFAPFVRHPLSWGGSYILVTLDLPRAMVFGNLDKGLSQGNTYTPDAPAFSVYVCYQKFYTNNKN